MNDWTKRTILTSIERRTNQNDKNEKTKGKVLFSSEEQKSRIGWRKIWFWTPRSEIGCWYLYQWWWSSSASSVTLSPSSCAPPLKFPILKSSKKGKYLKTFLKSLDKIFVRFTEFRISSFRQVVIRARNLRAGANFIPPKSFRSRRAYFSNEVCLFFF